MPFHQIQLSPYLIHLLENDGGTYCATETGVTPAHSNIRFLSRRVWFLQRWPRPPILYPIVCLCLSSRDSLKVIGTFHPYGHPRFNYLPVAQQSGAMSESNWRLPPRIFVGCSCAAMRNRRLHNILRVVRQYLVLLGRAPTGGEGVYNQWIHCDLIVIF